MQSPAISKPNLIPDSSSALEFVGGASRAVRARETLLRAILKHEFPDGRLPPEDELGRLLGVSRTTIRTALQSLEQHGVVNRTPGRGTSVHERMRPALVALQRLIGFADLMREQGHVVTYVPSLRVTDEPSPVVVEALQMSPDTECYEIERLLFADGQPAVWAVDVFPVSSFVSKLDLTHATVPRSPFDIDSNLFIQPIDHAVVEILPQSAGEELVEKLGLEPGQPCIMLREVHYSELGTALGFSAIHVNDLFVRFELIRRRERL